MSGRILFTALLLSSLVARAEQPMCVYKADDLGRLSSISQSVCEQTQKSPECQELYKNMSGEDLLHKSLECTNQEDRSTAYETYKEYREGCNQGGWNFVNGLVDVGNVGEEEIACDADIEKKRAIFEDYNISVPEILKLANPSEADLAELPCNRLKSRLQESLELKNREVMMLVQKKREKNLTPQEQEFVDYRNAKRTGPQSNLIESAKNKLTEMKIKYQCYNTRTAAEMVCEAAAQVGSLLAGPGRLLFQAAKAQKIFKIAGLGKVAAKVEAGGAASANLARMSSLSNAERIAEAEKALGTTLTQVQKDALIKAHEVGAGTGRGFTVNARGELDVSGYSTTDLRQKAKILEDAGLSKTERDILMRRGIAGSASDSAKLQTRANDLRLAAERSELPVGDEPRIWANSDLANKPQFAKTPVNTKAYKDTAQAYDEYLNATKNATNRDYGVAAHINARAENYEKSAEYFVRSKGPVPSTQRTEDVIQSLVRERDELRALASKKENLGNQRLQKTYKDHLKLMEAVTKLPNFPLSSNVISHLLRP